METISWSKWRTWLRCKRKYWYRYKLRLIRRRPEVPLLRGRIIGECLDARSNDQSWGPILAKYQKEFGRLFDEEREEYGDLIGDCKSIIARYAQRYENDGLSYIELPSKDKTRKPYEIAVRVDLGNDLEFLAYIDKVVQDPQDRVWVMDHKSHKNIPDENNRFSDLQLVLYVWGLDRCDYDIPGVTGVIWDYLRTKVPTVPEILKSGALTRRKDLDTDYQTYMNAILENGLDPQQYSEELQRAKANESSFFHRVTLPKPPKVMMEQVVDDLRNTATEIKYLSDKLKTRTMDRTCAQCSYFTLCHSELRGLDSEFVKKSEYIEKGDDHGYSEEIGSED